MELIKEKEVYIERLISENERVSVEEDIIVPDVKPDILKVLQVDARAYVTDRGLLSGSMYAKGKLYVNILYIPDSEEDGIGCIKTAFDFRSKLENPALSQDMSLIVSCDVSRADFSAINSRKLSVRATVSLGYEVYGEKELEVPSSRDDGDFECIYETVNCERISAVEECEFSVRDSAEIPSGKKAASEILKTDVRISDKEIKALQSKLILKGCLSVCILYLTEEGKTDYFEAELPFTEVFDVYELDETDICSLKLAIGEVTAELCQDNDGDMRILNIEGLINVSLCAHRCSEINLISDCYCPGKKTKITANEVSLTGFIGNKSAQNTVKEIITPDSKLPGIVKIYNSVAEPEITRAQAIDGGAEVEGRLKVYILYITDNSKCPVYSFKKEIPFKFSYEFEGASGGMQCRADIEVENNSCTMSSGGDIEFKCILRQEVTVSENKRINFIEEIETDNLEQCGDIVICFAKQGDTLWGIAKKYAVKASDIKEVNGLESDNISVGQRIVIPFCR